MIYDKNINIVIAGEAGQGIETAAEIVTKLLHIHNFNVFSMSEYMSRIRGGTNSALIKVSSEKTFGFSKPIDVLFAIDNKAFDHLKERMTSTTITLDLKQKNFFVIGYIAALFKLNQDNCIEILEDKYPKLFQDKNINDFKNGFSDGEKNSDIQIEIPANRSAEENMLISVNDALGLGCIAGGCNFISFYPMSPSTFLQTFLTENADEFKIVSKQVEDEICVINMALGAWYSGARAIACSSGGGFDLMQEGVSLAGIMESPIVINIAQRPGPATGLPTRTEQGDMNLAFYSGHGEFPRVIYAPATIEDAFKIGQIAFDIADKFQMPTFILTDQALLETSYSVKEFNIAEQHPEYIVKSEAFYQRYKLSDNPISPRAIPNFGEGIVCVDSDEHDENGWITEDFSMRKAMVKKRLSKIDLIEADIIKDSFEDVDLEKNFLASEHPNICPPYFIGDDDYKNLIISWGSNLHVIKESIKNKKNYALLHFIQVYPIDKIIFGYAKKAERLIIIEQNATGQFEKIIKRECGITFNEKLFKYNGEPFSIEEIEAFLEKIDEVR